MKIGIITQARMGSTRLPGKILKKFHGGKSLIEILLENLHVTDDVKVIVATSDTEKDNKLEDFLKNRGENVFRGSESDVLDRFIKAAEEYEVDGIVRICSDNPFMDREGITRLIEKAKTSEADYIGFRINDKPSILTHFGFWGEFVRLSALKRVAATTESETPAHEHVTYHIYTNPQEYKCEWIETPEFLQGRNDIRLTIDTSDDFVNASRVYSDLKAEKEYFTLCDVVEYLDAHEDIKESMIQNINRNSK